MSVLKYFEERNDDGTRVARTVDGYPLRQQRLPYLKQHELEAAELSSDARVRQFETDKPEDLADLREVLDRLANGLYYRLRPDLEAPLPAPRLGWVILMRWGEVRGELPQKFFGG